MITNLILVVVACLVLAPFLYLARKKRPVAEDETRLVESLQPVDVEAFQNLVDPEEERFLRANVPPGVFRSLQRQRLRAAIDYLAGVSHNAGVMLQLGRAQQRSSDPQIAAAGVQLVDTASRVRVYSLIAIGKLYGQIAWPRIGAATPALTDRYERMRECAALLSRLRDPARGSVVSRSL